MIGELSTPRPKYLPRHKDLPFRADETHRSEMSAIEGSEPMVIKKPSEFGTADREDLGMVHQTLTIKFVRTGIVHAPNT